MLLHAVVGNTVNWTRNALNVEENVWNVLFSAEEAIMYNVVMDSNACKTQMEMHRKGLECANKLEFDLY